MQRAAIVPDQEVAGTPDMLVDEFTTLLVVEQDREQLVALVGGQPLDPHRHQAIDVKRLASGRRMRAHHGMRVGWHTWREPRPPLASSCFVVLAIDRFAPSDPP